MQDHVLVLLNLGHLADEEILSLLTFSGGLHAAKSQDKPPQGTREQSAATRLTQEAQHASHVSIGSQIASQHDSRVQIAPNQAAPRKRPLPHSFQPVKRSAFVPPRGCHGAVQPGSHATRPSLPVSSQPGISSRPWPLSLRSNNQQQSAPHGHTEKQMPKANVSLGQRPGLHTGSAEPDQGKQRRLPLLSARAGTGTNPGVPPGRAADELHFSAPGAQQPVRLCTVPDALAGGAAEYASVWLPAVYEELNLQ